MIIGHLRWSLHYTQCYLSPFSKTQQMRSCTIRFNVDGIGPIDVDVTEDIYKKFSEYCMKNHPDKDWKSSET